MIDAVVDRRDRDVEPVIVGRRAAERRQLRALRQPAGGRREPIAPLERPADRRPGVAAIGQLDDLLRRPFAQHRGQHAVVRRDEPVVAGFGGDAAPGAADARIDHGEENRAGGEVARRRGQLQGAVEDVVRRHVVGDVHERGIGTDVENDPFHGARVVVAGAEVTEERDNGTHHPKNTGVSRPERAARRRDGELQYCVYLSVEGLVHDRFRPHRGAAAARKLGPRMGRARSRAADSRARSAAPVRPGHPAADGEAGPARLLRCRTHTAAPAWTTSASASSARSSSTSTPRCASSCRSTPA